MIHKILMFFLAIIFIIFAYFVLTIIYSFFKYGISIGPTIDTFIKCSPGKVCIH